MSCMPTGGAGHAENRPLQQRRVAAAAELKNIWTRDWKRLGLSAHRLIPIRRYDAGQVCCCRGGVLSSVILAQTVHRVSLHAD